MTADGADQVGTTRPTEEDLVHIVETETLDMVLKKIDDLIWRRKIMDKPHDQLEEIRSLVEEL